MKKLLCVIIFCFPVRLIAMPPDQLQFTLNLSENTTFYSFTPSYSDQYLLQIENIEQVPVYFMLLDEYFNIVDINTSGGTAYGTMVFYAQNGMTYHLLMGLVYPEDRGKRSKLFLERQYAYAAELGDGYDLSYFYGPKTDYDTLSYFYGPKVSFDTYEDMFYK